MHIKKQGQSPVRTFVPAIKIIDYSAASLRTILLTVRTDPAVPPATSILSFMSGISITRKPRPVYRPKMSWQARLVFDLRFGYSPVRTVRAGEGIRLIRHKKSDPQ